MAKKQNKKDAPRGSSLSTILVVLALAVAFGAYYVYNKIAAPVPAPNLDPEQWWGKGVKGKQDETVRPFKIDFSDVMIHDLRERLLHRRPFVPPLEGVGFNYGFNTDFLTQVLDFWKDKYDFKERENFLNKYDHFKTNIQGLDMHFIHVKPQVDGKHTVLPLLLLHGWPGSIREFYEIIPKLTTPRPGYPFVFEVIAPSLPGYGFSQATSRPGLCSAQVAVIMNNLMARIGHKSYYVQGGDWGHVIGSNMATLYPDNVRGFHTNMPTGSSVFSPVTMFKTVLGSFWPSLIVEKELQDRMYPISKQFAFMLEEFGYMHLQATKPDTVGAALTDSPAGLAAYILEKFSTWTNTNFKRAADGELLKKYSLTNLLDNIMIYWSTNSITTSMRLYAESLGTEHAALQLDRVETTVPTWGIKFKYELFCQPDSFIRSKFVNYLQSTIVDDGGHFAAFENPQMLADDVFKAVKAFIEFHEKKVEEKNPQKKTIETETGKTIYDFTVKDINGVDTKLDKYKGHVCIIVNVASQCGLTDKNYKQLNKLYEKYSKTKGLRILAFPCNQFNGQEPGSSNEIREFVKQNNVQFDLFEKIEVNGENAHPLWKFLKKTQSGTLGDFIKWNFSKFIIDKNGVPVERFAPNVDPLDLVPYLNKYW